MKKYEVVKSNELFNEIIQKGKKISNNEYIIFYMQSAQIKPHFGIAVGKKLGNAVERNKIKRQVRNIIDNNKYGFKKSFNYIIMVKKSFIFIDFKSKDKSFKDLLGKVQDEKE